MGKTADRVNGEVKRARRVGILWAVLAAVLLIAGAASFALSAATSRSLSTTLAAEVQHHCLRDTHTANARRRLDLALIAADRAYLAALARELPHADPTGRVIIRGQVVWLRAAVRARQEEIPAYRSPAVCAVP